MNTHETDDTAAVLAELDEAVRRSREMERLRHDRDSFARRCANAVNDGDMAASVDWAEEFALTESKLALVVSAQLNGSTDSATRGDER